MGNDGGSIPTRRELVKEAAKALTTDQVKEVQNERQEYAWSTDPLTRKPLARPVVSDSAGVLYNKDSILEFLVAGENDAQKAESDKILEGRVKSLKDVVEVQFEIDTSEERKGDTGTRKEKWVCPITNRELGPGAKAVYLVPCGHAFAGSVVKEVSGETCLQCNTAYAENDVIPILPTQPTDMARLSLRVKTLRERSLTHALKKVPGSKKRKKHAEEEANRTSEKPNKVVPCRFFMQGKCTKGDDCTFIHDAEMYKGTKEQTKSKSKSKQVPNASNGIKNAATASLTRKVLEEQEEQNKRRKFAQNENVKSLFSTQNSKPSMGNSADYMTRGFSVPSRK